MIGARQITTNTTTVSVFVVNRTLQSTLLLEYSPLHQDGRPFFLAVITKRSQDNQECRNVKKIELEELKKLDVHDMVPNMGQNTISTRWVVTLKCEQPRDRLYARDFEDFDQVQSDAPLRKICHAVSSGHSSYF